MRLSVNNTTLFFDVAGSKFIKAEGELREKPTLILLHGGPGRDHTLFKPFFERFSDFAQVIYLDQRGNGRSDRGNNSQWNLHTWSEDLHAFCEALDIKHPYLFGHSFGGFVAMYYALRYPNNISKLVLSNTTASFELESTVEAFRRLGGEICADAARRFWTAPNQSNRKDYVKYCRPLYSFEKRWDSRDSGVQILNEELMFYFIAGEMHSFDFRDKLEQIDFPVLVLSGAEDPVFPLPQAELLARSFASRLVQLEIIDGCSHAPFLDQAEETFRILDAFFRSST